MLAQKKKNDFISIVRYQLQKDCRIEKSLVLTKSVDEGASLKILNSCSGVRELLAITFG